jgi:hypothetical protein
VLRNKEENQPTCSLGRSLYGKEQDVLPSQGKEKRSLDPLEEIMDQVQTHYPMEKLWKRPKE